MNGRRELEPLGVDAFEAMAKSIDGIKLSVVMTRGEAARACAAFVKLRNANAPSYEALREIHLGLQRAYDESATR